MEQVMERVLGLPVDHSALDQQGLQFPTNNSGLEPLGRAVLVKPYEPERRKSAVILPDSVAERSAMVETRAIIIALGPHCWPNEPPRASVGDRVMISKFSGFNAQGPADGQRYRFINDNDIFAKIVHEGDTNA